MTASDQSQRVGVLALLFGWSAYLGLSVFLEGRPKSFWSTDASLYFRYLNDPDQLRFTLPVVASVLERAPTLFLDIARQIRDLGFDPDNIHHATWFFGTVSFLSSLLVTGGCYLTTRSLGASRLAALFAVFLMTNCWLFLEHSRPHELHGVLGSGYVSMLANAAFLMAFGLAAVAAYRRAALIAGLACWLHAVTGPLACVLVGLMALSESWQRGLTGRELLRLSLLGLLMAAVAAPFLINAVDYVTAPRGVIDAESWITYAWFRSANALPLRDGLPLLLARFLMLAVVVAAAPRSGRGRSVILAGAAFVAGCIILQTIFSEVLVSPGLTALVLHRVTTLLPLLMAAVLAYQLSAAAESNPKGAWPVALAAAFLLTWGKLYALKGATQWMELGGWRTDAGGEYASAAVAFWLVSLIACLVGKEPPRRFLMITLPFAALLLASLLAALAVNGLDACQGGLGCTLATYFENTRFERSLRYLVTVLLLFAAWWAAHRLAIGRKALDWLWANPRFPIIVWSAAILLLASVNLRQYEGLRLASYRHQELRDFIVAQTTPDHTLFSAFEVDLVGLRRQYVDWEYEWYSLYAPEALESLLDRLTQVGIALQPDSIAECRNGRWLLRYRCFENFGRVRQRVLSMDWRSHLVPMIQKDPNLRYVVVPEADLLTGDNVIARKAGIAIVAPEVWSSP